MNSAANGTPAFAVHDAIALDQGAGKSSVNTTVEHSPTLATTHQGEPAIALDGDKLKPRTDQRKGGNGFGVNEDGPGYTLTGVDRHGVAYGINNQGGAAPQFTDETSGTMVAASNSSGNNLHGVAYETECYENHAQDSRIKPIEVSDTRNQKDGTGGNNLPLVCFSKVSHPTAPNGEGERWDEREVSPTLSHQPSALEPTLAQDNGEAVSFTRASFRRNERFDISDATPTLTAKSAAGDTDVNIIQMRYIVRRLTPIECERLMGLPDGYTIPTGLRRFFDADGEPSPELVAEFVDIFDKFNAIMADYEHKKPPKGKSYNQVAEWLKKISNPQTCPDSPRYKGCGNGWATNQPRWILTRMLSMDGIEW